jgi:hypothetical protein
VIPTVQHGRNLRAAARLLEEELSKPADGPEVIAGIQRDLERLRGFGEGRMTPIPEESDIAGLMGQLDRSLVGAGLIQPAISTQKPKELDEASSLGLMLKVEGGFPAVYEAVREIEGLERLVRVGRFRVESAGPQRGDVSRAGDVRAEVLIEAFYAPKSSVADAGGGG